MENNDIYIPDWLPTGETLSKQFFSTIQNHKDDEN